VLQFCLEHSSFVVKPRIPRAGWIRVTAEKAHSRNESAAKIIQWIINWSPGQGDQIRRIFAYWVTVCVLWVVLWKLQK
jgi:hypothetical protein